MKNYIIDGNNLMGKIKPLRVIQAKDGQGAREKLIMMLSGYFHEKKVKVTVHFDGHPNIAINAGRIKIIYSEKLTADDMIKRQIENAPNPAAITMVSSDSNLLQFARVCRCDTLSSEEFAAELEKKKGPGDEESINKTISNEEMKRLFGL